LALHVIPDSVYGDRHSHIHPGRKRNVEGLLFVAGIQSVISISASTAKIDFLFTKP
jgi:hypothetical protein